MHHKITENCNKISLCRKSLSQLTSSPKMHRQRDHEEHWVLIPRSHGGTGSARKSGLLEQHTQRTVAVFYSRLKTHKCYIPQSQEGKLWSELEVHLSQISSDHSPHLTPEDQDEDLVSAVMFNALFLRGGCRKRHT